MKRKQIKHIALNIVFMLLIQIASNILIPIKSIAAVTTVTIQCNDINFYNGLVQNLSGKIQTKDDTAKTITMTQTNVNSVTTIKIGNVNESDELKITDITGIENFTNLTKLDLSCNQISDISVVSRLTNLTYLSLYNNQISDISALSGLTKLTTLYLMYNQISNISALSGLTKLTELDLSENQISDISAVSGLTNLTDLSLSNNQISDISAVSGLTKLTCLNLSENQISDISVVSKLTNLTGLALENNQISNISVLSGLTNLTDLRLANNQISNISAVSGLTKLTWLFLADNQISDISVVSRLTKLTWLNLSKNQISDISVVSRLTNLTYLRLSSNQISDISALSGLTNLTDLALYNNQISDITPIEGLNQLSSLRLGYQTIKSTIEGEGIIEIELPQIIKAAKDSNSKIYTATDYTITECSLSTDGAKIIVNTNKGNSASIAINGGNANGTTFTVTYNDTTPPKLEVTNSITTPTNQNVTVTITANEEIQNVDGWTLSEGKTILTKEYTQNGEEAVEVKDVAGNKTTVNVKVDNIDKVAPQVEVTNSITTPTNQNVTVTITANEAIKAVSGWTLDSDQKTLTKTYSENKSETIAVTDLAGNVTTAEVIVNNINKIAPNVTVKYSTVEPTNKNVTVTITADKEIQNVDGWTLSVGKTILTKEYTKNGEETVEVKDVAGNKTTTNVKVDNIDKVAPQVEVTNSITTLTNQNVTVTITANEAVRSVNGWTLSSDQKILTKTYSENKSETIAVTDLAGNITTAEVIVNNINKIAPNVTVKYSSVEPTTQNVIVTITADKEINQVESWTLDSSKKILTKEYVENKEEEIIITDSIGNTTKVNIKVDNIDRVAPKVEVKKSISTLTNQNVTVTITANEAIKAVSGWSLGSNQKTLTKTYSENKSETIAVTDLAGNVTTVEVIVNNINKIAPNVTVKYSTVELTNRNVIVTITSDKEINQVEGWTLDSSKKILRKEYAKNKEEEITITDLAGNTTKANIKVDNIDKTAPEVKVSYSTTQPTKGKVKVTITPNEKIQIPIGWILDEPNNTIYKEYDANTEETILIKDLAGNETNVKIKIENIIKSSNDDGTISKDPIPKAGLKINIAIAILFVFICGVIGFSKYSKYRDIK